MDRYKHLGSDEAQDDFKHALTSFTRLYSFLTQIMPFHDSDLEKLYTYGRFLLKKLPRKNTGGAIDLQDDLALEYYRLQRVGENANLVLEDQPEYELKGITSAGMRTTVEETVPLSEIIRTLNDRFGSELTEADRLFFEQWKEEMMSNKSLAEQAANNTMENFAYGFTDVWISTLISRMSQNREIFAKIMDDENFSSIIKELMLKEVYQEFRRTRK